MIRLLSTAAADSKRAGWNIALCAFGLFLLLPQPASVHAQNGSGGKEISPAPAVILIIADGLGISLQETLRLVDGPLWIDQMPAQALVRTRAANAAISDSAAGATAMAIGAKARNGTVGVDHDGRILPSIADYARARGAAVGLVTTSYLFDATPAAFLAHAASRDDFAKIAADYLEFRPALLFGGGEGHFLPEGVEGAFGAGEREDGVDVVDAFRKLGYQVVNTPQPGPLPRLGLFASDALEAADPVTLPGMAQAALLSLEKVPGGFFLLLEEENTDYYSHHWNVELALEAARRWNETVGIALAFQRARPNTIVVVTSDHETGSLSIGPQERWRCLLPWGRGQLVSEEGLPFCASFGTVRHTGQPVTLHASGIKLTAPIIENTDVFELLRRALSRTLSGRSATDGIPVTLKTGQPREFVR